MNEEEITKEERQVSGGSLSIPDGYFVCHANLDDENPYIMIQTFNNMTNEPEIKLEIPKSLAYYLSTHFCGSNKMREKIEFQTKLNISNTIREVLLLNGWE